MPLSVPVSERKHYRRNFIQQAVCELRFPTLYDFDDAKPPLAFANALRKEYPAYEISHEVQIADHIERRVVHLFKAKKQRWSVKLRPSSVSLETTFYHSFEIFEQRLAALIDASALVIDSDFFTRIGLRYINVVPYVREKMADWVNPSLTADLAKGTFGDVAEYGQQVRGFTPEGGYFFQHGIAVGEAAKRGYSLDYDFYAEEIDVSRALRTVRSLHDQQGQLFAWSLGPAARQWLESAEHEDV